MTDIDLKREFAGLLEGEPAVGPDVARALRGGKRAQVRQRYVSSAAGLAGVAVIAVAVPFGLAFATPDGSSGVAPGAGSSSPAPVPARSVSATPSPVPSSESATPSPVPSSDSPAPSPVPSSDARAAPATSVAASAEPTNEQGQAAPSAAAAGLPSAVPSVPGWEPIPAE
jgi:hypothetical protein